MELGLCLEIIFPKDPMEDRIRRAAAAGMRNVELWFVDGTWKGRPEVLAHELRHADGWEHHGACHSSKAVPDGVKLDGTPCDWYRP